jgi:NAD(P)H dehydrogenase (quinone)
MKYLVVLAHPNQNGFSRKAAMRFQKTALDKGHEVKLLDLYGQYKQDFLTFEDGRSIKGDSLTPKIQEEISWSDQLVFFFPLWWYEPPAILKNFIDENFSAGFAFNYKNGLQGMLQPRTAQIFITTGGPEFLYNWWILPAAKSFRRTLKNCGLKIKRCRIFGSNLRRTPEEHEAWLEFVDSCVA